MSTELKDRLLRIEAMCQGNSGVCKDIAFEARMALQAVDSQPFTVIAPPLEWGEWRDLHSIVEIRWSKCKKYKLTRIGKSLNIEAFEGDDDFNYPIKQGRTLELAAIAACQAHRQAQVNHAIEGCNVTPYRDPQGLVDALKKINDTLFKQGYPLNESDSDTFKDMGEDVESALKAWEDGK